MSKDIESLFRDHLEYVRIFVCKTQCMRYLRDEDDRHELLSRLHVGLWQACRAFDPSRGKLFTLAYFKMRNHYARFLRTVSLRERTQIRPVQWTEELYGANEPTVDPWREEREDERHKVLTLLLTTLPEVKRAVIELHYFQGLTYQEIGSRLRISRAMVEYHHRTGVKQMRARVAAEGIDLHGH